MMTSLVLTGCFLIRGPEPVYVCDYPELFSVALASVLGTGSDIGWYYPDIIILEEDDYGRILFEYDEEFLYPSLLIIQRVEDGYAYFYPHYNFILSAQRGFSWAEDIPDFPDEEMLNRWLELREISREMREGDILESFEEVMEIEREMRLMLEKIPEEPRFSDEEMERLKQANSWNQEMRDTSEFVRVRIVREKETGPVPPEILVEMHHVFFPDASSRISANNISYNMIFLRTDNYGRSIYSTLGSYTQFAILFQPDHSFNPETGILETTDRNNYQTELRLFMEANGWDTPFTD